MFRCMTNGSQYHPRQRVGAINQRSGTTHPLTRVVLTRHLPTQVVLTDSSRCEQRRPTGGQPWD